MTRMRNPSWPQGVLVHCGGSLQRREELLHALGGHAAGVRAHVHRRDHDALLVVRWHRQ